MEDRKRWEKLVRDIDSAQWEEDWSRIITLCKEALNIKDNPDIRTKLEKAEAKFKTENELKMFDQTIADIKDLILGSHFADARDKLAGLRRMSLDSYREAKVRDLNNQRDLRATQDLNLQMILLIGTLAHQYPSLNRQSLLLNLKSQNQMMTSLIQQ